MRIRPRADDDVARLLEIVERTHETDGYPAILPDVTADFVVSTHEVAAWVADVDGTVVGQVALLDLWGDDTLRAWTDERGLTDDLQILGRLFVDPAARRSGAARALLTRAMAEAEKRLVLDVMKEYDKAIGLYERAGWQRVGEIVRELRGRRFEEWVYLEN